MFLHWWSICSHLEVRHQKPGLQKLHQHKHLTSLLQKWKTELKILYNSFRNIALSKGTIFVKKNTLFFCKKHIDISKIKEVLVLRGTFSKTKYECVLLYKNLRFWCNPNKISTGWGVSNSFPHITKRIPKKLILIRVNWYRYVINGRKMY